MSARQRAEIPPATDELLAAGQRKVGEGRLNLRALKPAGIDDAETERHVEEITHTYGAHAQIAPKKDRVSAEAKLAAAAAPSPAPAPRAPHPLRQLSSRFARISRSGADRAVGPRAGNQNLPDYAGLAPRRIHREARGFGGRPAQNPLPAGLVRSDRLAAGSLQARLASTRSQSHGRLTRRRSVRVRITGTRILALLGCPQDRPGNRVDELVSPVFTRDRSFPCGIAATFVTPLLGRSNSLAYIVLWIAIGVVKTPIGQDADIE